LFNLRLIPNNTSNGRGHILDHNFVCYYVNKVLNNLKGPILKKNRNENFRSVDVSTKRKINGIGYLKEPPGKTPFMRPNHQQQHPSTVVAAAAGIHHAPPPQCSLVVFHQCYNLFPGLFLARRILPFHRC
jgi:hypothetical protein